MGENKEQVWHSLVKVAAKEIEAATDALKHGDIERYETINEVAKLNLKLALSLCSLEVEAELKTILNGIDQMGDRVNEARAFKFLIRLIGEELDLASDAYMDGGWDWWQPFELHAMRATIYLKDALPYAPSFTTPEGEKALRHILTQIDDRRIDAWNQNQELMREQEVIRKPRGYWQCPAQVLEGIDRMDSPEAIEFCLNRCKYQDRCDPNPKAVV